MVTAPVPVRWSVRAEQTTCVARLSPLRTPGRCGFDTPDPGEPPFTLLSPEDLDANLRPFSTPSTAGHVHGAPPGFAFPLTPRERIAGARQLGELVQPPVEFLAPVAHGEWPPVARQEEPVVRDSSIDCSSHDLSYLPFSSKVSIIRDILGDKVPVPVDCNESSQVRSLLSQTPVSLTTTAYRWRGG